MPVNWKGDEVFKQTVEAAKKGIDKTLADCVNGAKGEHTFVNRTGVLEGSIQSRAAKVVGSIVRGVWGSFGVAYAIFIETGTVHITAMPFLRPQTEIHYPELPENIKAAMPDG